MNKLIINISWNSKDWKKKVKIKSKPWVIKWGVLGKLNFASDTEEDTEEHILSR
jgi:hypothetical protein